MKVDPITAYHAAVAALAGNGARGLYACEAEDPEVSSLVIECDAEGVTVTLLDADGRQIGGYAL